MLLALGVGVAVGLVNCSKKAGDDPITTGSPKKTTAKPVCKSPKTLQVSDLAPTSEPGVLRGKASSADGQSWTFQVELSETLDFKQQPGGFDLSKQQTYEGCSHCVVAYQGDEIGKASKALFQSSGSMQVDLITSPPSGTMKGSLSKVELREVKIDPQTAEITEVEGGSCYTLAATSWDTTPPPDKGCQSAADCGDPMTTACDPSTGKCVALQCKIETGEGCDDKKICLSQDIGALFGACYARCTPFYPEDGCAAGLECASLDGNQTHGKCVPAGSAGEGAACKPTPISTGCQKGLVCVGPEGGQTCRKACDFFDATQSCGPGAQCVYGGFCSADKGDGAPLKAACSGSSTEGTPCASDGTAYRGACVFGSGLVCGQLCRVGSVYKDCEEGQVCVIGEGEAALPTCQPKMIEGAP